MKNIFTILILGVTIFFAKNFYDTRYERAMVGAWETNVIFNYPMGKLELEFEETFLKDGMASGEGKFLMYISSQFVASAVVETESTWEVDEDILTETLTSIKMGKYRGDGRATEIFDGMRRELKKTVDMEVESEILSLRGNQIKVEDENGLVVYGMRIEK